MLFCSNCFLVALDAEQVVLQLHQSASRARGGGHPQGRRSAELLRSFERFFQDPALFHGGLDFGTAFDQRVSVAFVVDSMLLARTFVDIV